MTSTPHDHDTLKYEHTHVHAVYQSIASHFSSTRYKPWPVVDAFLRELRPGSIGLDVGCGNGKYLNVNKNVFIMGSDRSSNLIALAAQHQTSQPQSDPTKSNRANYNADVLIADTLSLPHPPQTFDFAICIAVIHHLSSRQRRIAAIRGILQTLKIGQTRRQGSAQKTAEGQEGDESQSEQGFLASRTSNSVGNSGTGDLVAGPEKDGCSGGTIREGARRPVASDENAGRKKGEIEAVQGGVGGAERSPRLQGGVEGGLRTSVSTVNRKREGASDVAKQDHVVAGHCQQAVETTACSREAETSSSQRETAALECEARQQGSDTQTDPTVNEQTEHNISGKSKRNAASSLPPTDHTGQVSLPTLKEAGSAAFPLEQRTSQNAESATAPAVPGRYAGEITTQSEAAKGAGQALLFVWALEQQGSRRGWKEGDEQDVLVPWVLKQQESKTKRPGKKQKAEVRTGGANEGPDAVEGGAKGEASDGREQSSKEQVFGRYYHLYAQGELEAECEEAGGRVVRKGYDRDNWWCVIEAV